MRETDLVEMAFYAGWIEALGFPSLDAAELNAMADATRSQIAELVSDYVLKLEEESDA